MPVYYFEKPDHELAIEAKSEIAARVYLTKDYTCEVVTAKRLAALVMDGVTVESANKEAEADEASLRG